MNAAGLVSIIGWALVDFVWQGVLLALVLAPALALLRGARPQVRYAIAMAGLLACLLLPLASVLGALAGDSGTGDGASAQWFATTAAASDEFIADDSWRSALSHYLPWIVASWLAGAAVFALRFAIGCAWVSRQRAQAAPAPGDWQQRLDQLSSRMGLRRAPRLQLADALDGPAVAGCWRPVVLMPAAMLAAMPVDLLEALLAHELAHVRRHDYLFNLVQNAIETLLFYHPVVWWLSRRIRIEREQIADDLALDAVSEPRRLARALQQLDRLQHAARSQSSSHLVPAAHGGNLMNRIQRLILPATKSGRSSLLPLVALAALCLSVYAQATSRSEPRPATAVSAAPATQSLAAAKAAPATKSKAATQAEPAMKSAAPTRSIAAIRPRGSGDEFAYALVREGDDDMMLFGHSDDMTEIRKLRERVGGDFLWFRRDGKDYVVRDPNLLAEARSAWAPAQALGTRMEALGEEMQPHSERMEQLGMKMEAISGRSEPDHQQMMELGKRMEPLAERQRDLADKMQVLAVRMSQQRDQAARESLASQMEALEAQMRPLDRQMATLSDEMGERGRRLQAEHEPLEALGRQMQEAGKPMEALGERMGVLGKQQEALSHEADARVRKLLEQAIREGKAQPSPR